MNYATYAVAFLPFAKVPYYEVYGTNDAGFTRVYVMDDRTGKPAEFTNRDEAVQIMRGLYRAQLPATMSLPAPK
jgi:hypothetical protein